jgi:predicted neuraminidase
MPIDTTVRRGWIWLDPTGTTQVHASTLLRLPDRLLAAWFTGSREGAQDTGIALAHGPVEPAGTDDAWAAPALLAHTGDEAHWNPVLALGPDHRVWLFYKRGNTIERWRTWVRTSTDGRSWSPAAELPGRAGGGPVKNQPLLLADGSWLAPSSTETPTADGRGRWDAVIDVSADAGRSWTAHPIGLDHRATAGAGIIQPALVAPRGGAGDRTVVALCRSSAGRVYRATSSDGRRWTAAEPTTLPSNNSGLDAVRLPSGRIACVHNPSEQNWGPRVPLVLSCSDDDGRTWLGDRLEIEDGQTAMPGPVRPADVTGMSGRNEYAYPTMVLDGDRLLISYTWQRVGIAWAQVPVAVVDGLR